MIIAYNFPRLESCGNVSIHCAPVPSADTQAIDNQLHNHQRLIYDDLNAVHALLDLYMRTQADFN